MFVCINLQGNNCLEWEELSGIHSLLNLTAEEGMMIGGGFLSLCIFAYFGRTLINFLSRI